jgi:hypothetical protein
MSQFVKSSLQAMMMFKLERMGSVNCGRVSSRIVTALPSDLISSPDFHIIHVGKLRTTGSLSS